MAERNVGLCVGLNRIVIILSSFNVREKENWLNLLLPYTWISHVRN